MNTKAVEKRKFIRIPVNYHMECTELCYGNIAVPVKSITKNISAGGTMFFSKKEYRAGTFLKIVIFFSGWGNYKTEFYKFEKLTGSEQLTVIGFVLRSGYAEDGYYIAASFQGIDEGHQAALKKYILKKTKSGSSEQEYL